MINELRFTVDGQLMSELGERLVSKNHIALAELIKNCYDADATEVNVRFEKTSGEDYHAKGKIVISDNGHGMTLEQIRNYWMRIATANKKIELISPKYGRPRTGQKGIGRFACQKLADHLELSSTGVDEGNHENTKVLFEWKKFKPGGELTDIGSVYEHEKPSNLEVKTGTCLILTGILERWTKKDFNTLKRQILLLSVARGITRSSHAPDPGLEINIEAPEFGSDDHQSVINIYDEFRKAGWGTVTASVDENGIARVKLEAKRIGEKEYIPRDRYKDLAGIKLEFHWLSSKKEHSRNPEIMKKYVVDQIGQDFGGIRVYYNDFVVYPYGTPGDDWLSIDADQARSLTSTPEHLEIEARKLRVSETRPMLYMPRNQNLLGAVRINGKATDRFEIKIDREGFVENDTFRLLRKFVRDCVDWATLCYGVYKLDETDSKLLTMGQEFQKSTGQKNKLDVNPVKSAVRYLKDAALLSIPEKNKSAVEEIGVAADVIEESFEKKEIELGLLQNVASINSIMLSFGHEARELIARLDRNCSELNDLIQTVPVNKKQKVRDAVKSLEKTKERFSSQLDLFGILGTLKEQQAEYRYYVKEPITDIIKAFSFVTSRYSITMDTKFNEDQKSPKMYKAEFYTLVINLLSNAIKSVIASKGERIKIEIITKNNKCFVLKVFDDGVGLSKGYWLKVFEPFNADPENKIYPRLNSIEHADLITFGQGTGIGLAIVKQIVKKRGGRVRFIEPKKPWKACIEVNIPW